MRDSSLVEISFVFRLYSHLLKSRCPKNVYYFYINLTQGIAIIIVRLYSEIKSFLIPSRMRFWMGKIKTKVVPFANI